MTDNASRRRMVDGYQPEWDLDSAYGNQGELFVTDVGEAIRNGHVEVKRDGRWHDTNNLYVEYECRRANGQWAKSGIATTDTLLYAFVLGDTETAIIVPTELLKQLTLELYRKGAWYRIEERDGSHPTRGVKVPLAVLLKWLANRQRQIKRGAA